MRAAALVAVVGVVAVVVLALLAGLGLRGSAQPDPNQAGTATADATANATATADDTAGAAVVASVVASDPMPSLLPVEVRAEDRGRATPLLSGLGDATVLHVQARGFAANHTGTLRQCRQDQSQVCTSSSPVRFDDYGDADVQFLVLSQPEFDGEHSPCDQAGRRCVLEVGDGTETGTADLAFGAGPAVDVRLELLSTKRLGQGQRIEVDLGGTLPSSTFELSLCRQGNPYPAECLSLVSVAPVPARAATRLSLEPTVEQLTWCEGGACLLSVTVDQAAVRSDVVAVSVTNAAPIRYDPVRVLAGLLVAATLLILAAWIGLHTDWSAPRSADGHTIDEATYADLDAEAAAHTEAEIAEQGHPAAPAVRLYR